MARVQFNIAAAHSSTPAVIAAGVLALLPHDEEDAPRGGPGWFDSSWDLASGLEVQEGLPADSNLNDWIAVCLRA